MAPPETGPVNIPAAFKYPPHSNTRHRDPETNHVTLSSLPAINVPARAHTRSNLIPATEVPRKQGPVTANRPQGPASRHRVRRGCCLRSWAGWLASCSRRTTRKTAGFVAVQSDGPSLHQFDAHVADRGNAELTRAQIALAGRPGRSPSPSLGHNQTTSHEESSSSSIDVVATGERPKDHQQPWRSRECAGCRRSSAMSAIARTRRRSGPASTRSSPTFARGLKTRRSAFQ